MRRTRSLPLRRSTPTPAQICKHSTRTPSRTMMHKLLAARPPPSARQPPQHSVAAGPHPRSARPLPPLHLVRLRRRLPLASLQDSARSADQDPQRSEELPLARLRLASPPLASIHSGNPPSVSLLAGPRLAAGLHLASQQLVQPLQPSVRLRLARLLLPSVNLRKVRRRLASRHRVHRPPCLASRPKVQQRRRLVSQHRDRRRLRLVNPLRAQAPLRSVNRHQAQQRLPLDSLHKAVQHLHSANPRPPLRSANHRSANPQQERPPSGPQLLGRARRRSANHPSQAHLPLVSPHREPRPLPSERLNQRLPLVSQHSDKVHSANPPPHLHLGQRLPAGPPVPAEAEVAARSLHSQAGSRQRSGSLRLRKPLGAQCSANPPLAVVQRPRLPLPSLPLEEAGLQEHSVHQPHLGLFSARSQQRERARLARLHPHLRLEPLSRPHPALRSARLPPPNRNKHPPPSSARSRTSPPSPIPGPHSANPQPPRRSSAQAQLNPPPNPRPKRSRVGQTLRPRAGGRCTSPGRRNTTTCCRRIIWSCCRRRRWRRSRARARSLSGGISRSGYRRRSCGSLPLAGSSVG
ncbi:hypothetical protein C8Q73DRAFT_319900 [Cubamyces lactineus]|nr:hypothetical protein C8Q73DRAFT_319900 [Cubamyces lactineus]